MFIHLYTYFKKYQILPRAPCLLGEHFFDISVYLTEEVNVGGTLPLPRPLVLLQ